VARREDCTPNGKPPTLVAVREDRSVGRTIGAASIDPHREELSAESDASTTDALAERFDDEISSWKFPDARCSVDGLKETRSD